MRWYLIVAFLGLFLIGVMAGIMVRPTQDESPKNLAGDDVGAKAPEQARNGPVNAVAKEERRRPEQEDRGINEGPDQAETQLTSLSSQLVALQKEMSALQQELSVARLQFKEEREKVAVLEEETGAYRQDASGLQTHIEALEKTLTEQEYLRLVNEALVYSYRKGPGDAERAETAYRNAIRIAQAKNIRDPVAYNAFAVFLQEQSRFKESEEFYQMALGVNPSYGPTLYNLGTLYESTGKLEEALEKYKAADEAGQTLGAENYSRLQSVITK